MKGNLDSIKDGSMSKAKYSAIHVPHVDVKKQMSGHGDIKGARQFQTAPPKKGQTANTVGYGACEYRSLYANQPYRETHKEHVRSRMEAKKKFMTSNGFVYSSPAKRRCVVSWQCGCYGCCCRWCLCRVLVERRRLMFTLLFVIGFLPTVPVLATRMVAFQSPLSVPKDDRNPGNASERGHLKKRT